MFIIRCMGYYENLSPEEQGQVLAVMAGLKLNRDRGQAITREDVNAAFLQATGKPLSVEYMRDPAVIQLMSLVSPARGETGAFVKGRVSGSGVYNPSIAITDRNLAARGLPVPKAPAPPLTGTTRYSASAVSGRFGK